MKKLKVLQIIGSMNAGGVESFVMSYFRELHELCEFTFLCFDDSLLIPQEEIESLGGKVIIVPHVKHLHAFNKALTKVFKENHFDIVHSHLNTLSVFPLRVAKKCKQPIRIAHSHSISSKKEWKRHLAKSVLKTFSKTYSNVYFSCSELTGRYQFGNKAFDKGEVTVIKNAIKTSRFEFNEEYRKEIRNELGLGEKDYVIGTLGRFVDTKNHQYVLKLAKDNQDIKFIIVGNGPLEVEYNAFLKENNLSNIQIIVPDQNKEIARYYSAIDMFILPSLYEGFPLSSLEAQVNGLYIIYSESVPKEGFITGYGEFLPITEEGLAKWKESFHKPHPRNNKLADVVRERGYDIKDAAKALYDKYLELLETHK